MPLHALAALLRKRQARFPYVNAMTFEQWHSTHGFTAQLSRGVKPQLSLKSLQHLEPPTYGDGLGHPLGNRPGLRPLVTNHPHSRPRDSKIASGHLNRLGHPGRRNPRHRA